MEDCTIYFGGVPPVHDAGYVNLDFGNSFLGSMRGLTVSNPGSNTILNPLYAQRHVNNPFYGIVPNCERKVDIAVRLLKDRNTLAFCSQIVKPVSFEGDGFLELDSQPLRSNSSLGFSFRTNHGDGVLVLSTFAGKEQSGDSYSVAMSDGRLVFTFGSEGGGGDGDLVFQTPLRYNDGIQHTVSILKRHEMHA